LVRIFDISEEKELVGLARKGLNREEGVEE